MKVQSAILRSCTPTVPLVPPSALEVYIFTYLPLLLLLFFPVLKNKVGTVGTLEQHSVFAGPLYRTLSPPASHISDIICPHLVYRTP